MILLQCKFALILSVLLNSWRINESGGIKITVLVVIIVIREIRVMSTANGKRKIVPRDIPSPLPVIISTQK